MPTSPVRSLIEHICRAAWPEGDGELLGRFVERRDERALAALVERHGPMVWGVCRRLLAHHDAEDAFQATFIVLVRRAGSVKPRGMVGNWLYGVARQVSLQARTTVRRRAREIQVTQMPDVEAPQDRWADVRPILDEELSRLPDHYRAVIVLCDLESRSRKEVARQFGCPEGTIASRLARAREMLAKRLTARGVALSGGVAVLAQGMASAAVPASVMSSTIKAASLCAAGQAVVSLKVAALTEGVLKAMLVSKLKAAVAVVLVLGFLVVGAIGVGIASGQQKGDTPQVSENAQKVEDAVVKEKAEKEDATAWGKEVDGLQVGLVADAGSYRQGEKAKLTVKLRNVGKAEIKITYGVLRECAAQVTTDTGGKVSVYMPAPFDGLAVTTKRTLKPGEMIRLYNPEVAVESEARARLKGIMRVETPTICVTTGKYKIAYGGMIQSHPKLSTETVEFEVKDQVAWGKEAGGLQAGLFISNANNVRIGGKAQMVVRLRNVSKETIKVSVWPLWTCYPGVVDGIGKQVPTTRAPSPSFAIIPEAVTLKPGATVDVGRSDLVMAEPDQKVTVPEGVVDLCAIHVKPGMFKADCIGFLKENQMLATGTVDFEVKPAEVTTAWGKELGGLQAGLSAEKRAYSHGETVKLVVRVRNVSKEAVEFKYISQYLDENPPTVTGPDGKVIPQGRGDVMGVAHIPVEVNLEPGKETVLETRIHGASGVPYELRPAKWLGNDGVTALYGKGKFQIQYERVFGNSSIGRLEVDPVLEKLATGKLELEVKDADDKKPAEPAAKQEKEAFTEWGKEVGGLQAGLGFRPGEKRAYSHGETVKLVVRVRNVSKDDVKFQYFKEFFSETPPAVTGGKGKAVIIPGFLDTAILHLPVNVSLASGKEIELYELKLQLRPASDQDENPNKNPNVLYGTGTFSVQYERVLANSSVSAIEITPALRKLATGKLELEVTEAKKPEKKEQEKEPFTTWGKKVGGLQAGLGFKPGDKRVYHHGETVTLVLRVRNVGKEDVKFRYLKEFFMEKPPTVTGGEGKTIRLGGVDFFHVDIPVDVNLTPGKDMELHDLKIKLAPAGGSGDVTEVSPETLNGKGKFQIQYEQLAAASIDPILSKLATGKLELEVKEAEKLPEKEDNKEAVTVWGKEVGGLQAGLGFRPGEKRAYSHGETVTLVVRVRNVGKEEVTFQYVPAFFQETLPTVTHGTGEPVLPIRGVSAPGKTHPATAVTIAPGKEVELYEWNARLAHDPLAGGADDRGVIYVRTGKFSVQYERVLGNSSASRIKIDPALSKLATGKLELEVTEKK